MIFERKDVPTIQDGKVIRYKDVALEISASRNGVCLSVDYALVWTDRDNIEQINKCLLRAYAQYKRLRTGNNPWTELELDEMGL